MVRWRRGRFGPELMQLSLTGTRGAPSSPSGYIAPPLEPIHGGGEAEHPHEGASGLLLAGGYGPPLLEPAPEPLNPVAVRVGPVRAGHRGLLAFRWDRGTRTAVPDVGAKIVRSVAPIRHDPARHPGQAVEQGNGMWKFVGLSRRDPEGHGAPAAVCEDYGLRAIAAARAPKRLTFFAASGNSPLLDAPAAFACALMLVPSRNAIPSSTLRACAIVSRRLHTPSRAQRMKICAAFHHGPSLVGMARHCAPFVHRQRIASTVHRRSEGGTLAWGRQASTRGSNSAHSTSVNTTGPALRRSGEGGAAPQALTGPSSSSQTAEKGLLGLAVW